MVRLKGIPILLVLSLANCEYHKEVFQSVLLKEFLPHTTQPKYVSKVSMSVNPGCSFNNCTLPNGAQVSVVNVTVKDHPEQTDEQHWIWSVIGRPTVQTAITPPNAIAKIDWTSIFDTSPVGKSIRYEKPPFYTGAVMLMNLIEFDDPKNTLNASGVSEPIVYSMMNFRWNRQIIETTDERIAIRFIGTNYTSVHNETGLTGTINLTISAYSNEGYGHWLPHLSHSSKTCQVDIQLQTLVTESGFNSSRYAIELYFVSNSSRDSQATRQISKTLDDEHTPGIFQTNELILPGNHANLTDQQSYIQWRPVVYTTPARELSESTGVVVNTSVKVTKIDEHLNKTLLYILYGDDLNQYFVRKVNVTFGSPKDGFYKKTKYHAWTFTFGVGEPIRNGLSPVIILAITTMLGALVIVFSTAGIVCCVKKWKNGVMTEQSGGNYQRIRE